MLSKIETFARMPKNFLVSRTLLNDEYRNHPAFLVSPYGPAWVRPLFCASRVRIGHDKSAPSLGQSFAFMVAGDAPASRQVKCSYIPDQYIPKKIANNSSSIGKKPIVIPDSASRFQTRSIYPGALHSRATRKIV